MVVHRDDFTFLGDHIALDWCTTVMQEEYDIKNNGNLGPDKHDQRPIAILNRCVEWRSEGIYYEPDPRHAEIIIDEIGFQNSSSAVAPGIKTSLIP